MVQRLQFLASSLEPWTPRTLKP